MKRLLKAYMSFTRTERAGLVGLLILLLLLVTIKVTMLLFVHPRINTIQQEKLVTAWQQFEKANSSNDNDSTIVVVNQPKTPTVININTADSATLTTLDGIGPVLAHRIIERRKELGHFTNFNELLTIPRFPKKKLVKLKEQLEIK